MESYINLDKNMTVTTATENQLLTWYDVHKAPFGLHGFYEPLTEPYFHRLPDDVGAATSEAVSRLQQESAGGRVRFSTDSPYIAIRAKYRVVGRSSHLTLVSSAGFDLYEDGPFGSLYVKEFRMPYDMTDQYEQLIMLPRHGMRAYTINFPIHSVVETLEVGLHPEAKLGEEAPYRDIAPIVYYGSSIVHGTAASRPGLIYENYIARSLNMDYINLGFSGNAKGEQATAKYMATLPMSVFVCDYDHNAPSPEHLEATHWPMYETIREKNPDVPYIMITRPNYYTAENDTGHIMKRRDIIMRSYLRAREAGDENVYFIDGTAFFADEHLYDYTMDHVHPNDLGFLRMAQGIGTVIRHALEKSI